jgi:hypothetical protein
MVIVFMVYISHFIDNINGRFCLTMCISFKLYGTTALFQCMWRLGACSNFDHKFNHMRMCHLQEKLYHQKLHLNMNATV